MSTPPWASSSSSPSNNQNPLSINYDYTNTTGTNNNQSNNYDQQEEDYDFSCTATTKKEYKQTSIIGGAAIAGTTVGMALAGPFLALVSGITAATIATQSNTAGNIARSTGKTVLHASDTMKDIDDKHKIVQKTKWGIGYLFGKAKEVEDNHRVVEKTRWGFGQVVNKAKEVDERHEISDRANDGLKSRFGFIIEKFNKDAKCNYTSWQEGRDNEKDDAGGDRSNGENQYLTEEEYDYSNHSETNNDNKRNGPLSWWPIGGNKSNNNTNTTSSSINSTMNSNNVKKNIILFNPFKGNEDSNFTPWPDR